MKKFKECALMIIMMLITTSCATVVSQDYPKYLQNNVGAAKLIQSNVGDSYFVTEYGQKFNKDIRSFTAGYGNKWVIDFAGTIDATFQSNDYVKALGNLSKLNKEDPKKNYLKIELVEYDFRDHRAYLNMKLDVVQNSKVIFSNQYEAKGISQGGKMFWAGAMGMKNAIQQSTMYAMNDIFGRFTRDFSKNP